MRLRLSFPRPRLAGGAPEASRRRALLVLAAALVAFLSINLFATLALDGTQADITAEGTYTVSPGARGMLEGLDEPVHLRLYASAAALRDDPQLGAYAERVRHMLEIFVTLGRGRIRLDVVDPAPFSTDEDRALAFGLRQIPSVVGRTGFFGLAGTNTTDDVEVIAFLAPERERFLEYDLTRVIHALARHERPIVAVLDGAGILGNGTAARPPQAVIEPLRQFFDLRVLPANAPIVPAEVRVLLLVQPTALSDATLYAIDQYAMRGGRVVAFIDPALEVAHRPQGADASAQPRPAGGLGRFDRLLAAWGVDFNPEQVVADNRLAQPVEAVRDGRRQTIAYPPWITVTRDQLARDSVVTGGLSVLALASSGALVARPNTGIGVTALVGTSADAALIPARLVLGTPDPERVQGEVSAAGTGQRRTVAVRISGAIASAFADGPPRGATQAPGGHRRSSVGPFDAIVVADVDMLFDAVWLRASATRGVAVPAANNGDFLLRAVDHLSGDSALLTLPVRPPAGRPLELLQGIRDAAERAHRDRQRALQERLRQVEDQINRIAADNATAGIDVILTAAQQRAIIAAREDALRVRAELREVQRALQADVDRITGWVMVANIAILPALVALSFLAFGIARRIRGRRRMRPRQAAEA